MPGSLGCSKHQSIKVFSSIRFTSLLRQFVDSFLAPVFFQDPFHRAVRNDHSESIHPLAGVECCRKPALQFPPSCYGYAPRIRRAYLLFHLIGKTTGHRVCRWLHIFHISAKGNSKRFFYTLKMLRMSLPVISRACNESAESHRYAVLHLCR
jgi:hypothetical protein